MSTFFKKSRQSEVKEFFEDLGKTAENRNRPVVREKGRVITFEDGQITDMGRGILNSIFYTENTEAIKTLTFTIF